MGKIANVQEVPVNKLVPYERNAKIHGTEQVEKLKASIEEFGFLTPCLIDSDYNLIAGHGRLMAAKELNMKSVPCVFVEGLSEEQRRAYILADNKLGELAEWDAELVADELNALKDMNFEIDVTGFTLDDQILDNEDIENLQIDGDFSGLVKQEPESKSGQLWKLGRHRLLIGDSTNLDDVRKLVGGRRLTCWKLTRLITLQFKTH